MKYHLTDIYNIEELRRLCESFTSITDVVIAILDMEGNVHVASGWKDICTKFHRIHPETQKLCNESDTVLAGGLQSGSKYNVYKCKNGLMDVAMPIIVDGMHLGNLFTGQFLTEKPNVDFFREQAQKYGFDETAYLEALADVPVFSEEQIKSHVSFLVQLTEVVGDIGLKNLNAIEQSEQKELEKQSLKKINEDYERLNKEYREVNEELSAAKREVQKSEETYRMLFQNLTAGFALHEIILDTEGKPVDYRFLEVNTAFELFTGLIAGDIIGKTVLEVLPNTELYWIETYGEVALTGKNINFENYSHSLDKYYQVSAYSPEPGKFATVFLDITKRKKAEDELRIAKDRYEDAERDAQLGHWTLDIASGQLDWSKQVFQIFEIDHEGFDPTYEVFFEAIHPDDRNMVEREYYNALEKCEPYEATHRLLMSDGRVKWVSEKCVFDLDDNGRPILARGIVQDITERKLAVEALLSSDRDLKESQRIAHVGSWHLDIASNQVVWSEELYRMYGFDPTQPPPPYTEHKKLFTEDSWEKLTVALDNTSKTGFPYELELETVHEDGSRGWMWVYGRADFDANGKIVGLFGAAQDVTERKESEDMLRAIEARNQSLIQTAMDGFWRFDMHGNILEVNAAYCEMTGYTEQELLTMKVNELEVLESTDETVVHMEKIKEEGQDFFISIHKRKNGQVFDVEICAQYKSEEGGYIVAFIRDITERKQTEEKICKLNTELEQRVKDRTEELHNKNADLEQAISKLQETQSQLILFEKMTVLRHLISGIAHEINNPLGAIESSREMLERDIRLLVSHVSDICQWVNGPDGELLAEIIDTAGGNENSSYLSFSVRRKIRSAVIEQLNENGIEDAEELAATLVEFNIHDRVGHYLPLLRHTDILDKLSVVRCILDSYTACSTIKTAVAKSSKIVNALRSYTRKEGDSQSKTATDIRQGIETVLQLFQNTFKFFAELEIECDDNLPLIPCYPDQLNQVWTNLIQNALYAMNNSGKIRIEIKKHEGGVLVRVIDHGCGMTPEVQARVFEPLFTTKPAGEGIGLGMDIVHMIITERHNGKIEIESEPGEGTTISVYLPA